MLRPHGQMKKNIKKTEFNDRTTWRREADVTTPLKPVLLLFLFRILQLPLATLLLRRDDIYHRVGIMSSHQKTPTKTSEEKKEMAVLIALRVSLLSCRVRLHRGVFHGWLVHRWWRGILLFTRSKKKKRKEKKSFVISTFAVGRFLRVFCVRLQKNPVISFFRFRILVKISQWV